MLLAVFDQVRWVGNNQLMFDQVRWAGNYQMEVVGHCGLLRLCMICNKVITYLEIDC
jgi:hypothetical protein